MDGRDDGLRERLSQRIGASDVTALSRAEDKEMLFELVFDPDTRVSDNALWVLTHLPKKENKWFLSKRETLIDEVLSAKGDTRCRLCLALIERTDFESDDVRTDFLDFCLAHTVAPGTAPGIQSLCIKLAYKQCRHWVELVGELRAMLENVEPENISKGTRCALNKILKLCHVNG